MALVIIFSVILVIGSIAKIAHDVPARGRNRRLHYLSGALFLYGVVAFLGQAVGGTGGLAFMPNSLESPVLLPSSSASDSSGNTVVALNSTGRIQIYAPDGHFIRGWYVEQSEAACKVRFTASGDIEVFSRNRNRRYVYDLQGHLLSQVAVPETTFDGVAAHTATGKIPRSLFILWPFAQPFAAWSLIACGQLGLWAIRRRERRSNLSADAAGDLSPNAP